MKKLIKQVEQFHNKFNHPINDKIEGFIGNDRISLRYDLMKEENEEYLEAAQSDDEVEVADALGDMLYILCGTIIEHGMQDKIEEVFNEIQRSNMSKLGEDGQPILREDGKILKGPNYFKPNIAKVLERVIDKNTDGMYGDIPKVAVGEMTICQMGSDNQSDVWIENGLGEGGQFKSDDLCPVIKEFFNSNF